MLKISNGNGAFYNGIVGDRSGIPGEVCEWSHPDKEIFSGGYEVSACTDGCRLFHCKFGDEYQFVEIDPSTGEHSIISRSIDDPSSGKIAISGNYLMWGDQLFDYPSLRSVKKYNLVTPGQINISVKEQVLSAIDNGFLFFSGGVIQGKGAAGQRLLHCLHTDKDEVVELGFYDVVLPSRDDVIFTINGRVLSARDWVAGQELWRATIQPRYELGYDEKHSADECSYRFSIVSNDADVFVSVPYDGVHRFDVLSGELTGYYQHRINVHRKYRHGTSSCFSTTNVLYIFCYDHYLKRHCSSTGICLKTSSILFHEQCENLEIPIVIAGDLILYKNITHSCFRLRDRYDGSVVWSSEDYLVYGDMGILVDQRYFIYDHMGHSMCFEWQHDYATHNQGASLKGR